MSPRAACSRLAEVDALMNWGCACDITDTTAAVGYLDDASDLIYQWSGYTVFGLCERTIRPCRNCHCGCGGNWGSYGVDGFYGSWAGRPTNCCSIDKIPLRGPVVGITQIKIDGAVLDPASYQLVRRDQVMRIGTGDRPPCWPENQALWRPDTETNTFSITYTFGMAPPFPSWVTNATLELACDLAKAAAGKRSALPPNTSQVFFQGAAVQMTQDKEAMARAVEALPAVAKLIAVTNANGYAGVYSPDGISCWEYQEVQVA